MTPRYVEQHALTQDATIPAIALEDVYVTLPSRAGAVEILRGVNLRVGQGEAVAIAAGAWLAGRKTVLICQNSGLGNAINPLTSLNRPFRIPTLMIVTWRGQPGLKDEPQHVLMGQITDTLLDDIGVPNEPFPNQPEDIGPALERAANAMAQNDLPYAFIMAKGSVGDEALEEPPTVTRPGGTLRDLATGGARPSRDAVLARLLTVLPDAAAVVVTTGKSGRELFTLSDREQHLYQVGSMGGAMPYPGCGGP